ncbi:DUF1501 domain-containing protein [Marinicella meishanensis]|uniref:DUF1501 domain-containing protein n=1 Tax=Marinicella meishanensis TaxID=2873263 RepID=UPI001CBF23BC|nr:DUF1501 domain-containing protein [Marinicella sp. NBU2979]
MNRRKFLNRSIYSTLLAGGMCSAGGMLQLAKAASLDNRHLLGTGYKALVCVFMDGGNDSANMVVPRGAAEHAAYAQVRGDLALNAGDVLPISPANNGGRQWGLHPELTGIQSLFNQGRAALVSNIGSLAYPITQEEYNNGSVPIPPNLFSHSDQQVQWQTSVADQASLSGWAGRIADLYHNSVNNNNSLSMNISIAGNNTLQVGELINQYHLTNQGSVSLNDTFWGDGDNRLAALQTLLQEPQSNLFQQGYADIFNRSIELDSVISAALAGASPITTAFPEQVGWNTLSEQLEMVANMINVQSTIGMNRQVFFVRVGGFDNHDNHLADHAIGMQNIDGAISAFYDAMIELNMENNVTLFTASDFSRTWISNGQGSDHGWGGSHFVIGGDVNGGDFYGDMPIIEPGSINAISDHGRCIPTIAVDEYGATLARWFGVANGQIADVFPNIGRFNSSDLGFMNIT